MVAFIIVGQASALVCALMMAGVAGSAICTDLGSRKIREEIDAMEVMGIDVVERLVAPRLLAAVVVSVALCAMVTFGGVMACYLYHIYVQHLPAGTFLATFGQYGRTADFVMALVKAAIFALTSTLVATFKGLHAKGGPRGVADAVNEAVVIAFALVFVVNTALSALYTVIVPAVERIDGCLRHPGAPAPGDAAGVRRGRRTRRRRPARHVLLPHPGFAALRGDAVSQARVGADQRGQLRKPTLCSPAAEPSGSCSRCHSPPR